MSGSVYSPYEGLQEFVASHLGLGYEGIVAEAKLHFHDWYDELFSGVRPNNLPDYSQWVASQLGEIRFVIVGREIPDESEVLPLPSNEIIRQTILEAREKCPASCDMVYYLKYNTNVYRSWFSQACCQAKMTWNEVGFIQWSQVLDENLAQICRQMQLIP